MKLNSKKTLKLIVMMMIVMLSFTVLQPVFAAKSDATDGEITPNSLTASYATEDGGLSNKAGKIMGLIRNVAVVVGVIMLMVIGVKFMLGSAEEKAEYKKSLMPLVIGIVIVMMATTLVSFVYNFTKDDDKNQNKKGQIVYVIHA